MAAPFPTPVAVSSSPRASGATSGQGSLTPLRYGYCWSLLEDTDTTDNDSKQEQCKPLPPQLVERLGGDSVIPRKWNDDFQELFFRDVFTPHARQEANAALRTLLSEFDAFAL